MAVGNGFFRFTRRERRGALALLFLCLAGLLLPAFFARFRQPVAVDFAVFEQQVSALESLKVHATPGIPLFPFDPNAADESEWRRLGLPPRVVKAIINYRKKGGRFRHPEDLKRIYTLQPEDFQRLKPFIRIENNKPRQTGRPPGLARERANDRTAALFPFDPNIASREDLMALGLPARTVALLLRYREKGGRFREPRDIGKIYGMAEEDVERLVPYIRLHEDQAKSIGISGEAADQEALPAIDVNLADTGQWNRLKGIGPALSQRIVNFREKLGGFASVDQVGETFGLSDTLFSAIRPFLRPSQVFRQLAINRESWQGLSAHPYISQRQARAIVSFREQHGPFRSVRDLDQLKALTPEWKEKMAPYWTFE